MLRILESQAPAKQNATDAIATLSTRLQSANLLEDRRAAILGLRSFAKLYPASVASGALRDLLAGLRRDGDDSDTIKVVLETILMLFEPDAKSLEASEEITLWLADEFTQRQDNITALLDLLESGEFYLRLYALQILSHVSVARPERTQDAIFSAPLGVSRLVAVLDDKREAARNEALVLLVALTPSSPELQKVIAFENAFDRIFAVMEADGALTHGSSTVQDCLSLLANLLRLNTSNQSYFREIGCISKIIKLLRDVAKDEDSEDGVSDWIKPQRDVNLWGTLAIIQLFLLQGGQGTKMNQAAFWQQGTVLIVLQLAFSSRFTTSIRSKAFVTCGDLIRGHATLQEQFSDLTVPRPQLGTDPTSASSSQLLHENGPKLVNGHGGTVENANVIEVLLQLILEAAPIGRLDLRLAACACMQSFFADHPGIRNYVLKRAIDGYTTGEDHVPNIFEILLQSGSTSRNSDIYQTWMASLILMHLLMENSETKSMALAVSEGDADNGEEVITLAQGITTNVVDGVRSRRDERPLIGYLMLLCIWLFEEPDAVNDVLTEGSNVQSLIQIVKAEVHQMPLVSGLAALLLGIVYEFSSKDSPIPRKILHGVLTNSLGRDVYVDRLTKLRENVFVRDFEVLPQNSKSSVDGGLPQVYFDQKFIDFLKDNFSRMLRAIDRDPNLEVSVVTNGVQKGISRELVDSLRAQLDERTKALQLAESELVNMSRKFEQEELDHRRTRDSTTVEVNRIKQINQSLHEHHDKELSALHNKHDQLREDTKRQHNQALEDANHQYRQSSSEAEASTVRMRQRFEAEVDELKQLNANLELSLKKAEKDHLSDLQTAHEEYSSERETLESRAQRAEEKAKDAEAHVERLSAQLNRTERDLQQFETKIDAKERSRADVQTELDDLLVVFADLEAKRSRDKGRLKELGEVVSDDEDGDEVAEEDAADTSDLD